MTKTNFFVFHFCDDDCEGELACPKCGGDGWTISIENVAEDVDFDEEFEDFSMSVSAETLAIPKEVTDSNSHIFASNSLNLIREKFSEEEINNAIDWKWVKNNPWKNVIQELEREWRI
tara:strand:+ start:187 stop:540 length:354 start_codon:yes stop_codon:yes gene_type:complete